MKQTTWILLKAISFQETGIKHAAKINGGLMNKIELCHAAGNFFAQPQKGEPLPMRLTKEP